MDMISRDAETEKAKDAYLAEFYPEGVEIDIDDNLCECATWTVGEHRCSCGNRRIYLNVGGNLEGGFYAWPEAD